MLDFAPFTKMVETTMDLTKVNRHIFLIKSSFMPELEDLRNEFDDVEEKMEKLAEKAAKDLKLPPKSVKLECNDKGYYFRVSRKVFKKIVFLLCLTYISYMYVKINILIYKKNKG